MIPILRIGRRTYAFKKAEDASRVLALVAAAQPVEMVFHYKKARYFYHPRETESERTSPEIGLELIQPSQLCEPFSESPDEQPENPPPLRRGRMLTAKSAPRLLNPGGAA